MEIGGEGVQHTCYVRHASDLICCMCCNCSRVSFRIMIMQRANNKLLHVYKYMQCSDVRKYAGAGMFVVLEGYITRGVMRVCSPRENMFL